MCILKNGEVKGRGHSGSEVVGDKIHASKSSQLLNLHDWVGVKGHFTICSNLFKETGYQPATGTEANGRAGRRIKGL